MLAIEAAERTFAFALSCGNQRWFAWPPAQQYGERIEDKDEHAMINRIIHSVSFERKSSAGYKGPATGRFGERERKTR